MQIIHICASKFLPQRSGHDRIFMAYTTHCNSIIREDFFKPLFEFLPYAKNRRECLALSDATWLEAGVRRCLGIFQSGRDFLQQLADLHLTEVAVTTFFESYKSKRRLRLLDELLAHSRARMRRNMPDAFASHACLDDFDLYAGDGHFIAAACHDLAVVRDDVSLPSDSDGGRVTSTKYATGHLYTLDLRTHAMSHLTVADQAKRKKEHDMRALKRQTVEDLRQGAAKGRKVLYIWDRAGIDFRQWYLWKQGSGIYFLSRQKDNMDMDVCGKNRFDATDPVNQGVLADQIVGTCAGVTLRRVSYMDAQSGVIYHYLTNLPTSIPPGVVALLYKSRWDVEKVFDEFKNKLVETKSWASSANAKTVQARMLCLTHNLMTLMEEIIRQRYGVTNVAEFKRRGKRQSAKSDPESSACIGVQRLTQRTVKFIRWLKNHLDLQRDWDEAIARLVKIYSRM